MSREPRPVAGAAERPKNLTAVVHCRVPSETKEEILKVAESEGRKPAGWLRRQIELGLRKASFRKASFK